MKEDDLPSTSGAFNDCSASVLTSSSSSVDSSSDASLAGPSQSGPYFVDESHIEGITRVPRYKINLDLPPEQRWQEVGRTYRRDFKAVQAKVKEDMADMLGKKKAKIVEAIANGVLGGVTRAGIIYYGRELRGLAEAAQIPVGKLALLQLVYEAASCCTSIVVHDSEGTPIHIRTMDWGMDFLRPLTCEFEFQSKGQTVFVACSWAGYVGVLTGMRPNGYSVSVNFRVTGDGYWQNVKKAITYSWPIGFLLREVFESESQYTHAVGALALSSVIAPVYFTICGTKPNEGTLVTRNRDREEQRWTLEERGTIVQTNIDHWSDNENDDILYSIERRALARNILGSAEEEDEEITEEFLWSLLSNPPILNSLTVSGTFMCAAHGIMHTRIPQDTSDETIGFQPCEEPIPFGGGERTTCTKCSYSYLKTLNPIGDCAHIGEWHSTFADCNKLKCGLGLKTSIGYQHWSCCFSTEKSSSCPKSGPHC